MKYIYNKSVSVFICKLNTIVDNINPLNFGQLKKLDL